MFEAIDIAGSGINVDQTWIDTIGGNVANSNDGVTPGQPVYQAQYVDATPVPEADGPGLGVQVQQIELGSAQGQMDYEPTNPKADAQGEVAYPVVDLAQQMTGLIESQTSYQANASVMNKSTAAYQSILDIKA
jgi:flagellar basal-body rod protein FlgC